MMFTSRRFRFFWFLAALMGLCLTSCEREREVRYARLNKPALSALLAERQRVLWASFEDTANVFAPATATNQVTADQQRTLIRRFYEFMDTRDKLRRAAVSPGEQKRYYSQYRELLAQRLAVLDHVSTTAAALDSSKRAALFIQDIETIKQAITLTRLELKSYQQYAAAPDKGPWWLDRAQRANVLCFEDSYGLLYCMTEKRLATLFVHGHWSEKAVWVTDRLDLARGYDAIMQLDRFFALAKQMADRIGLTADANTILACANGKALPLKTSGPDPRLLGVFGKTDPELPSLPELAGMSAACGVLSSNTPRAGVPGSGGGLGGSDTELVERTIEAIDEQLGRCGQGSVGGLSAGGILEDLAKGKVPGKSYGFWDAFTLSDDTGAKAQQEMREWRAGEKQGAAIEAHWKAAGWEKHAKKREQEAKDAQDLADELAARAANNLEDPEAQAEAEAAEAYADQKKAEAEKARAEANKQKQEADKKKKDAEEATRKAGVTGSATGDGRGKGAASMGGDLFTNSCENVRAWWDFFKWHCDDTNGWDRPGTACNQLIRRENGCMDADPRVTTPTLDGGRQASCIDMQPGDEEVMYEACRKKEGIATPVGEDPASSCGIWQHPSSFPFEQSDICGNPQTRPKDGQCVGDDQLPLPGRKAQPIRGPFPQPIYNLATVGGVSVFDGLNFDCLGCGQ